MVRLTVLISSMNSTVLPCHSEYIWGLTDGRARSHCAHVDAKSGVDGTATDVVGGRARRSQQNDLILSLQKLKAELQPPQP